MRGSLREVADHFRTHTPKGEFVIVLAGKGLKTREERETHDTQEEDEEQ